MDTGVRGRGIGSTSAGRVGGVEQALACGSAWARRRCRRRAARSAEVEQQHWASAGMRLRLGVGAAQARGAGEHVRAVPSGRRERAHRWSLSAAI
jgi:hypothetical protein